MADSCRHFVIIVIALFDKHAYLGCVWLCRSGLDLDFQDVEFKFFYLKAIKERNLNQDLQFQFQFHVTKHSLRVGKKSC